MKHEARLIAITKPVEFDRLKDLIVYCARVSNPSNQTNFDTSDRLLSYLQNNKHWSPLEMANLVIEIKTNRTIARQILRHRSFSFQEFSQRYAEVSPDDFFHSEARLQDSKNRQSSLELEDKEKHLQETLDNIEKSVWKNCLASYQELLKRGIAKEVARNILPEGLTPSIMYVQGSIRSWVHYCELRTGNGTQKEHRIIAEQCKKILEEVLR